MNRTTRLMTAVTAALLLNGTASTNAAMLTEGQTAPQPDDPWKTDPQVEKAADTILDWLKGTTQENAKTAGEVSQKFPDLGSSLVEKALKRLVWQGDIRRAGDGSESSPYTYFEHRAGMEG
jgi:hypothetical protein